jgi:hypothetical protein
MTPFPLSSQTLAWLNHAANAGQRDAQVLLHLIARADAQDQWFAKFTDSYSKTIAALCRRLADLERGAKDLPTPAAPVDAGPVANALLQAEAALADVAEGEAVSPRADECLHWTETRCTEALAAIRPVMRQHGIQTAAAAPAPGENLATPPAPVDLAADQAMAANLSALLVKECGLHSPGSSTHDLLQRAAAMLVNYGLPAHPATPPAPKPGEVGELVEMLTQEAAILEANCNKIANGECRTLACLQRGGYIRGTKSPDSSVATCLKLEKAVAKRRAATLLQRLTFPARLVVDRLPEGVLDLLKSEPGEVQVCTAGVSIKPLGDAARLTFQDAIHLVEGCHDYSGGHSGTEGEAWHGAIDTVVAVLKRAAVGPSDSQLTAVYGVGSEAGAGEVAVPVAELDDQHREAVQQAVAEALGSGAYDCLRVWEAWGVGTMGPDDFVPVAEDSDRVAEIADAAIEAIRAIPAPQAGEVAELGPVAECPHCGYEGEMVPAPQAGEVDVSERLRQIGLQLRTQDNRCTANPIFQVRGKQRIYGLDLSASDEVVWMDDEWNPVDIPEDADPDQPPHGLTVARYTTRWKVLMVAFTEQGCIEHLRLNGHNYRIYDEVGIYVDSLNRCPEMIAIREFLLGLPAPQAGVVGA